MTLYSLGLFLHVLGAIGLFVALGLEWPSLRTKPLRNGIVMLTYEFAGAIAA